MDLDTIAPPYTASDLPAYTPNARRNERTVDATAGASTANISATQEYQYKNGSLTLNLGPKRLDMFRPAYGWNDTVAGFVFVKKKTKNVLSLVVSVEGHVTTGFSERGYLTDQSKIKVLGLSQTLFDASLGQELPTAGTRYAFSFPLPSYVTAGGLQPLPPTFAEQHPGMGADVRYSIRVDMVRKGMLRQNEKLVAWFYYLPRTYAPLPRAEALAYEELNPMTDEDLSKWHVVSVLPQLPCGATSTPAASVTVSFGLPQPLVYAAGSSIPFFVTIASGMASEALPSLLSCLSVQLVRVTTLVAGSRRSASETIIGGGEVVKIADHGGCRKMFGNIMCLKRGNSSWAVDTIEVKYVVRVRLAPRGDVPSLVRALPRYTREEVVVLKTHQHAWHADEPEATLPALCLAPRPAILT